jgi:flagellar hook-basal body complex protein FliE
MTMIASLLPLAASALHAVTTTAPAAAATSTAGQADFGHFMAQATGDALKTLKTAEQTSMAGIEGKASASQVVGAVMNAERTLQTTISIRDKAVAAYQQISQMQI